MEENKMEQQQMQPELEAVRKMVREMLDEVKTEMQNAASERMKMEGMTDEQKMDYAMSQREKAIQEREKKLLERELKAKAVELLAEKNLPRELADALPYGSEAECLNGIEKVENAFREAVKKTVDARLRGQAPASGMSLTTDTDKLSDSDYYRQHFA